MAYETEKLTINLGVVELAQVDVLVDLGIYSNRSDFIRAAIRSSLDAHKDKIEKQFEIFPGKINSVTTIGIYSTTKRELERLALANTRINIYVIGMAVIPQNISAELFATVVESCVVRGKLVASEEIKAVIANLN